MYKYILHHLINVATQFCKTQNLCFFSVTKYVMLPISLT